MTRSYDQICPIARTLDVIGDRWTILILRDMLLGTSRFNDFLNGSPGLPSRMLSDRLKRLERYGLVERRVYSQHPLRAEYHLTEKGLSLSPVLEAMARWGIEHFFEGEPELRAAVLEKAAAAGWTTD